MTNVYSKYLGTMEVVGVPITEHYKPPYTLENLRRITMDWLTIEDATYILKLTPRTIRELIYNGKLEAGRIGRTIVIHNEDLQEFASLDRPAGRPLKKA